MNLNFSRNPSVLNKFLKYLLNIENRSINTVKSYNSDLMIFFEFLQSYLEIPVSIKKFNVFILARVKKSDIIAFLIHLNFNKNNNPVTRQHRLEAIKKFYDWLFSVYKIGENKINPAKKIENAGRIQRLPKYLNLEQAQKLQTIFTKENCQFAIRNNTIIALFLCSGIRASELINIDIKHINFNNSTILIHGKGNKERIVYFNKYCKKMLLDYLEERSKNGLADKKPLFLNRNNERIGITGVENICKKAYSLLGLGDRNYTAHTLRHTAATLLYTYSGEDIILIKSILGHESLISTEIYTHLNNKIIKNATERNPLNNFMKGE